MSLNIFLSVPIAWWLVLMISPVIADSISPYLIPFPGPPFSIQTLHPALPMWPAVHMPTPWLPKWWSWIWSRDEHIPKVIGAIHKFKVTRDEIWFLLKVHIHSHTNVPFNTGAISHLQPQWINQRKLGTDFWKERTMVPVGKHSILEATKISSVSKSCCKGKC